MSAGIVGKLNDARQILMGRIDHTKRSDATGMKQLKAVDRLIKEALACIPAPKDPVMDDHDGGFNACLHELNDGPVTSSDKGGER